MILNKLQRYRRHSYYFSRFSRADSAPVLLCRNLDMTSVQEHRRKNKNGERSPSYISYLIKAISQTFVDYPEANACFIDGIVPKVARYRQVNAKVTLDKTGFGTRAVLSSVIVNSSELSLEEIQTQLDQAKSASYETSPMFAPVRKLDQLPIIIGRYLYNKFMRKPDKRHLIHGSFTLSSLGRSGIDSFYPMSSNTLTFGAPTVKECPVVVDGQVVIRPILPLTMVFDHRVIDGALAAEILSDISRRIETIV